MACSVTFTTNDILLLCMIIIITISIIIISIIIGTYYEVGRATVRVRQRRGMARLPPETEENRRSLGDSNNTIRECCLDIPRFEGSLNN